MKAFNHSASILILAVLMSIFSMGTQVVFAQKKSDKTEKIEEYLTIMVRHYDGKVSKIYITQSGGDYEEMNFDINEEKQKYNMSPVIKLLEKYDKAGWKLEDTSMMHVGDPGQELFYTYYIFRRKRKVE
jgi:hypothetical protein